MTRGAKEKVKLIEVKPVKADDRDHMLTLQESNVNALPGNGKIKFHKFNMLSTAENDLPACDDKSLSQDSKKEDVVGNNMQKKEKNKENEPTSESKCNSTVETPVEDEIVASSESVQSENKGRKLPCLFGFISTWLAKRKERRRIKKRKAIEARNPTPEPLVEYEHKKARGGVAFTVEVDSRPMRKPVLPPIKQCPGPIVREIDEKLKNAEIKRSEELEKKKISSKEHAKKKAECHDRKADKEFYFKQKVDLTIRHKQSGAQKNRARFHEDRRCSTPLLRAPSTLPPLRGTRVKQAASADEAGLKHDPDDAIFDF